MFKRNRGRGAPHDFGPPRGPPPGHGPPRFRGRGYGPRGPPFRGPPPPHFGGPRGPRFRGPPPFDPNWGPMPPPGMHPHPHMMGPPPPGMVKFYVNICYNIFALIYVLLVHSTVEAFNCVIHRIND